MGVIKREHTKVANKRYIRRHSIIPAIVKAFSRCVKKLLVY